jgi:hypothetical protein
MPYHAGTTIYLPGFDWSRVGEIPVKTVRKFGNTAQHPPPPAKSFGYTEGEKVEQLKEAGKRVIGTFTVASAEPDGGQWNTMSEAEWRGYVERYVADVPVRVVEVGNEPGVKAIPGYFSKLRIAAEVLRADDRWVIMGAPYPGAESAYWEAAKAKGAWEHCDAIACHPYAPTPAAMLAKLKGFRGRLTALGTNKALHLTEFGWATSPVPYGYQGFVVNEQTQATYLKQAFELLEQSSRTLKLNNCLWYSYNDWNPWGVTNPEIKWPHRCGVIRLDYSRKPSYAALAEQ